MSDITVEKKLAALNEIRSTYHKNQYDLSKRERILYGKSAREYSYGNNDYRYKNDLYQPNESGLFAKVNDISTWDTDVSNQKGIPFLKIRFVLAITLMIGIILIDQNSQSVAGFSTEQIFQAISYDYTDMIETWIRK